MNRGPAIRGDKLYMGTLDAHLIALDRKNGALVWDSVVEEPKNGYSVTLAPLVVNNKVIVGVSCGDFETRKGDNLNICEYTCSNIRARCWRSTAAPGSSNGITSSRRTTFTTGMRPRFRCWQISPSAGPQGSHGGESQRLFLRSGLRERKAAAGQAVHRDEWAREIGADGRPVVLEETRNSRKLPAGPAWRNEFDAAVVRPGAAAVLRNRARNVRDMDLHEATRADYARRACAERRRSPLRGRPTTIQRSASPRSGDGAERWEPKFRGYPSEITLDLSGSAMSTATGLVFSGDNDGYLYAFDSASGKELWRFQTGAPVWGIAPIPYMLDGRQWVSAPSGATLTVFALPKSVIQ